MWSIKWHWDKLTSEYFGFPLSVPLQQCSVLTFIYMLLLPDKKTDDAWETAKEQSSFGYRWALNNEVLTTKKNLNYIYGFSYY